MYHANRFRNSQGDAKSTWKHINQLLGRTVGSPPKIKINVNGSLTSDESIIAGAFAQYYSSAAVEIKNNIPVSDLDLLTFVPYNNSSLFLLPATPNEVSIVINSLKSCNNLIDSPRSPLLKCVKMNCRILYVVYSI